MSERFDKAAKYAVECHSEQKRKISGAPYVLHPFEVATIAATMTDDEDVLIAALLHDVVEDTPATIDDVERLFGDKVGALVRGESENKYEDQPPDKTWKRRKEESLAKLASSTDKGLKILWLSDKLANIRSYASAYDKIGDELWQHFNQKDKNLHKWYYKRVLELTASDLGETYAYRECKALYEKIFGR